ncbi:MAG TPA: type 1 glutamine amidotransferase [Burkholderiales bacterium]|nr:type 1 glutamine amidotransferase [Burkholderiales bacterium]
MKPVAIFRHSPTEGPGYFAAYLDAKEIPWELIKVDQGESVPPSPRGFSGLVFMGGPMSVNDDLPWIPPVLQLIRSAVEEDVPCLGHCLGGQLMSKALGGEVTRNPVKEIGWGSVQTDSNPLAKDWLGNTQAFLSFHWHGETFSIPEGGTRILSSPYCANQAFVLGKHLGMQCHVEMTPEMIRAWCHDWGNEVRNRASASIQTPEQMEVAVDKRVKDLHRVAATLYDRWIRGLSP